MQIEIVHGTSTAWIWLAADADGDEDDDNHDGDEDDDDDDDSTVCYSILQLMDLPTHSFPHLPCRSAQWPHLQPTYLNTYSTGRHGRW